MYGFADDLFRTSDEESLMSWVVTGMSVIGVVMNVVNLVLSIYGFVRWIFFDEADFEGIGNIHDNYELLKGRACKWRSRRGIIQIG